MDRRRRSEFDGGVHAPTLPDIPQTENVFDDVYAIDSPTDSDFNDSNDVVTSADAASSDPQTLDSGVGSPPRWGPPSMGLPAGRTPPRNSIYKNPFDAEGDLGGRERFGASVSGSRPQPTSEMASVHAERPLSVASSYAPSHGASSTHQSGPSFSYSLYQHNNTGLARPASVATASTSQVVSGRQSILPTGPSHPYAMYSQNVGDGREESAAVASSAVHAGFSGQSNSFHRRLGPDGEEQDIVGPDGHEEQLPPYSRYPEEVFAKMEGLARPPASASRQQTAAPGPDSMTDARAPIDPGSERTKPEPTWKGKSWKERRRVKLCGGRLPCWVVGVLVGCAIVIAGLVAGLVGGLIAQRKEPHPDDFNMPAFVESTPIPAPTGVPGLPNGTWALPLGIPEEMQNGCLTDTAQLSAWTCLSVGPPLMLDIANPQRWDPHVGTAALSAIAPNSPGFNYGVQPMYTEATPLDWVIDIDDRRRGPALHFQAMYDKIVIVSAKDFGGVLNNPSSRLFRRDDGGSERPVSRDGAGPVIGGDWGDPKMRIQIGDQPWMCYWNSTFIEGFIYMTQNSSDAASQASAHTATPGTAGPTLSTTSSDPTPTTFTTSSAPFIGYRPPLGLPTPVHQSWYASSDVSPSPATPTASTTYGGATPPDATPAPPPPANPVDLNGDPLAYTVMPTGPDAMDAAGPFTLPRLIPLFPHIAKIEERRANAAAGPSPPGQCVKMQLVADDSLVPLLGPDNAKIVVTLKELDPRRHEFAQPRPQAPPPPPPASKKTRPLRARDGVDVGGGLERRTREPPDSCHCQWRNT